MEQKRKEELFNELASAVDAYAWVSANLLKDKFGVVDSEEEYEKIKEEVVDYVASEEFKELVKNTEKEILDSIIVAAQTTIRELEDGND